MKKRHTSRIYQIPAGFQLAVVFFRAMFFWKTHAQALLNLPPGKKLNTREYRRWRHYFFGTTFLGAVFCQMTGRYLSRVEKIRFAKMAALASLFDDQTDGRNRNSISGFPEVADPEEFGREMNDDGLALYLLQEIYSEIAQDQLPLFKQNLQQVFNLEISASKKQFSPARLPDQTLEKGAFSVLLFRRLMDRYLAGGEQYALFEFGRLVQLCDDIFDVWFDRQNDSPTLATVLLEAQQPEQLQWHFERQVQTTVEAVLDMNISDFRKNKTLAVISFLVSVTLVCLRHYRFLKKKHGTLPLDDRRSMVVDMARWQYRWQVVFVLFKLKL